MNQTEFKFTDPAGTVKNCRSPRILPSLERLRELLSYEEKTGIFRRRMSNKGIIFNPPKPTGCVSHRGYILITVDNKNFYAHRLAWFISTGTDPGRMVIDHINGDSSDNRIENLRVAKQAENVLNARLRKDSRSGIKGVSTDSKRGGWVARVRKDREYILCKSFATKEEAESAAIQARHEKHGAFSRNH